MMFTAKQCRLPSVTRLLLWLTICLSGCTQRIGGVLEYQPIADPPKMNDQTSPPVAVEVTDKRPTQVILNQDSGIPGINTEYVPRNDVAGLLAIAFTAELKNRGWKIGVGGNTLSIALSFFVANQIPRFLTPETTSSVGINVMVTGSHGALSYICFIEGQSGPWQAEHSSTESIWFRHTIREAIQAAIQDAVAKVFADPAFIDALKR